MKNTGCGHNEAPNDSILMEDLISISDADLPWREMIEKSILVTGATGLVGSVIVRALACANRRNNLQMRILPLVRSKEKYLQMLGDLGDRDDITVVEADILSKIHVEGSVDYIIHGASITSSKTFVTKPVETIMTALKGTENLLELARKKRICSMVYLSSMEAFGITDPSIEQVGEKDLGYIDISNIRSSYSESKRMCELICLSYFSEYDVPVKTARLAQVFGAGVDVSESRVFAQFAKSVIDGEDIVLHTKGESTGNYCYTADAVKAILTILLRGRNGETYTVANPETTMRIRDIAAMLADDLSEGKIKVVFDIPDDQLTYGYAPDVNMHLNSDKLRSLGWEPQYGLMDMYVRLIDSFRAQREAKNQVARRI